MSRSFVPLMMTAALALGACVEQQNEMPSEDDIKAAHEHVLTSPPAKIQYPNQGQLEEKLQYLGLDVDTDTVVPGKPFTLTHYWKVLNPTGDDWKLFIHLESPDSKKNHLNADHTPISGKYPLALWKKGEIIRDSHRVSVPQSWPSNQLEIYVGAWKGPLRMKTTKGPHDSENRILAVKLPVQAVGPLRVVGPGTGEWAIRSFRIRDFPLPDAMVPRLVSRALGDPGRRTVPWRVPAGVRAIRLRTGSATLYGAPRP